MSSQFPSGGGNPLTGAVAVKTTDYTIVAADGGTCIVMNSASAHTVTLPATLPNAQFIVGVLNIGVGLVTIARNGHNINGAAANGSLTQFMGIIFTTDGTDFYGAVGAVLSVAGRTGAVVLAESDITGLVADLATLSAVTLAQTAAHTTSSLAANASEQSTVTVKKMFTVLKCVVSSAARVRLYSTAAAQAADLSRTRYTPPAFGSMHGVLLDLYLDGSTAYPLTWILAPAAIGFNGDGPQTTTIYCTVTNIGSSATTITFTLTYVQMET